MQPNHDETPLAEMIATSRQLALAVLAIGQRKGMPGGDLAELAAMAMGEVMLQHLGLVGTVERLRDLADVIERDLLAAMAH
ncbi:hypothetical protein [Novosphingobium sp.]|uniref:hypothetical protein n=1 Tax=Novosphingobium sp. TaxID=1874826 RepID=UPI00262422D9|nr:hypothetical protein [Novosphingobium sp.]